MPWACRLFLAGVLAALGAAEEAHRVGLETRAGTALGATGVLRASFELLHLSQLWNTLYGIALLVKTAIPLVALAAGWFLRARIRVRARVELGLAAG